MAEEAWAVVEQMESYTEISPSGSGLRILVACAGFQVNTRTPQVEIYSHSRFLTITGHHLAEAPDKLAAATSATLMSLLPQKDSEHTSADMKHSFTPPQEDGMPLWARIFARDRYGARA